jgi:hypothetical protein
VTHVLRGRILPLSAFLLLLLVLLGLGRWQLDRLAWKKDLIAALQTRLAEAPAAICRRRPNGSASRPSATSSAGCGWMRCSQKFLQPWFTLSGRRSERT